MQGLVAVEKTLSKVVDCLEARGYEVIGLEDADLDTVDAIVVSGADVNLMNMQDALTEVPVINAAGKSTDEILQEIERI